jgi:hypothetical protein
MNEIDINPSNVDSHAVGPASTAVTRAADLATEVNELHRAAKSDAESAVDNAIRCGRLLLQQKEKINKHGLFRAWIAEHCEFSQATATRYMHAAKIQNDHGDHFRIGLRALLPPPPLPSLHEASGPKSEKPPASTSKKKSVAKSAPGSVLTQAEYVLIYECLDPDRDADPEKLERARKAFMKLDRYTDRTAPKKTKKVKR